MLVRYVMVDISSVDNFCISIDTNSCARWLSCHELFIDVVIILYWY